ncbi:hypothetical protein DPQ22_03775 [Candidatus Tokpelaia sp.]|nr:hypothetical protein DPQ22_03775 [Candidatus Tokpelaia sp.]
MPARFVPVCRSQGIKEPDREKRCGIMKGRKIRQKAAKGEGRREGDIEDMSARADIFAAGLSGPDREIWAQVARNVRPLRRQSPPGKTALSHKGKTVPVTTGSTAVMPPPGRPAGKMLRRRGEPALKSSAGAKGLLRGFERNLYRRLAQGRQAVDAKIDLHGYTQAQAYKALLHFVQQMQRCRFRHILIITGKGKTCQNGGILQKQVPHWLVTAPFRLYIAAIEQAAGRHGGEGAFYVRLRRLNTGPAGKD